MDRQACPTRGMVLMLVLGLVATVLLAACGGGAAPATPGATGGPAATPPPAGATAVRIAGFAFDPATVTVKVGATVSWTNEDDATHTISWDDGTAASGPLTKGGAPYTRTFDTPGTFFYACGIHPSMKGTVVVEP